MSNLINLSFENQSVTTAIDGNGEILFRASELATALGFGNPRQAISTHVDNDDIQKLEIVCDVQELDGTSNKARKTQKVNFVNESGMYALIFGSTKDEAKRFKRWVTSEVLPSIRKTGTYRHTISVEQQAQIRQAVAKRCQSNSTHYQSIYTALHHKFGIPRYDELLAKDFDEALVFITDFKLADDVSEYNALWKLIGLLEYERIDHEIRELKRTIDTAYQQIERISRTKGLIYDAISEQRTSCPHNIHRLNEAKAFIARQMAMKQRLI